MTDQSDTIPAPAPERARILVLLVEDYDGIIRAFRTMRDHLVPHWELTVVTDGVRALEILESPAEFDCVLLDIILPHMNGMEIFMRLERNAPNRLPRTLFISGGSHHTVIGEFVSKHRATLLEKPVAPNTLIAEVERLAMLDLPRGP